MVAMKDFAMKVINERFCSDFFCMCGVCAMQKIIYMI